VRDARGRAAQDRQVAEGYKQQAVAEAKGQSARSEGLSTRQEALTYPFGSASIWKR